MGQQVAQLHERYMMMMMMMMTKPPTVSYITYAIQTMPVSTPHPRSSVLIY